MTSYQILKSILHGATITIIDTTAYLDKYKSTYCVVDFKFIKQLIYMDIIEKDSGNFETREEHYLLNDKFIKFDDKTRQKTILLKTMDEHATSIKNVPKHSPYLEFEKAFEKIKHNVIRKKKLEKLENESSIYEKNK
jgi:predicted NAD-dependent protein-ADP-ribosyltransferase YbiA (DUF1768 family)